MVRLFANGPGDRRSILGRVILKTQKWYFMPLCLIVSIIRHRSRENGVYKDRSSTLPNTSVANEKRDFGSNYSFESIQVPANYI